MKHAFLVIAHNDFELLKIQLKLLDDLRNDIYIHIDKKSNFKNFDELKSVVNKSNVKIYKEIDVKWGDSSQVECELFLLRKSVKNGEYKYYHIISGSDLPIKTQDEIHNFFNKNAGKEFIHFDSKEVNQNVINRVMYRHFFSKYYKISRNKVINKIIFTLDNIIINIQRILNLKKDISFKNIQKGCNWCSITDGLAKYILKKEKEIRKLVKNSKCADEVFIQTIVENSKYKENLYLKEYNDNYDSCSRLILWNNETSKYPHTFTVEDWTIIKESNKMFARKFSTNKDIKIINKIYNYIQEGKEK